MVTLVPGELTTICAATGPPPDGSVALATKPPEGGATVGASAVPDKMPISVKFLVMETCS